MIKKFLYYSYLIFIFLIKNPFEIERLMSSPKTNLNINIESTSIIIYLKLSFLNKISE